MTIQRFESPALIGHWMGARDEIYAVMQDLPIPDEPRPPKHTVVTVLVRPGLCVFGPNEGRWLTAWRYSNHLTNAFSGSIFLVTEYGWVDFMTDTAGHMPAMAAC